MPLRVTHIITELDTGGAETMLYHLLTQGGDDIEAEVISLADIGAVGKHIQALGIPVRALGMRPSFPNPLIILKLARWLRQSRPQVIQTWLYHADFIGGVAAKLAGGIPVVWGLHTTRLDPKTDSSRTIWLTHQLARLSGMLPTQIIACAEASREAHVAIGYQANKIQVIENGFDLAQFQPDDEANHALRAELDIPLDTPIIGHVARFHAVKDHHTFVMGAKRLLEDHLKVQFVMCGKDVTWANPDLRTWIGDDEATRAHFHLLGRRADIPKIYPAFDVFTLSSLSEAFPMTVGEAMACGLPCVVTDVGDSAQLVADTGRIVPPSDPQALASAWDELLSLSSAERQALGERARQHIEAHYSLPIIAERYHSLHTSLARP